MQQSGSKAAGLKRSLEEVMSGSNLLYSRNYLNPHDIPEYNRYFIGSLPHKIYLILANRVWAPQKNPGFLNEKHVVSRLHALFKEGFLCSCGSNSDLLGMAGYDRSSTNQVKDAIAILFRMGIVYPVELFQGFGTIYSLGTVEDSRYDVSGKEFFWFTEKYAEQCSDVRGLLQTQLALRAMLKKNKNPPMKIISVRHANDPRYKLYTKIYDSVPRDDLNERLTELHHRWSEEDGIMH